MNKKNIIILILIAAIAIGAAILFYQPKSDFPQSKDQITKLAQKAQETADYAIYLPGYIPEDLHLDFRHSELGTTAMFFYNQDKNININLLIHPLSYKEEFLKGPYVGENVYLENIEVNNFEGKKYTKDERAGLYLEQGDTFMLISQSVTSKKEYNHEDLIKIIESMYIPK